MNKVFSSFSGRHTFFAVFFTLAGTGLQWFGKLNPNYIMLIAAIQAFVFAHSIKEDVVSSVSSKDIVDAK